MDALGVLVCSRCCDWWTVAGCMPEDIEKPTISGCFWLLPSLNETSSTKFNRIWSQAMLPFHLRGFGLREAVSSSVAATQTIRDVTHFVYPGWCMVIPRMGIVLFPTEIEVAQLDILFVWYFNVFPILSQAITIMVIARMLQGQQHL